MAGSAVLAVAVVITTVLVLAGHHLSPQLQLQKPCGPAPECLHALGGGLIAPGGGFDHHVTLPQCTEQLARYAAEDGAYWTEVELAVNMAFESLQLDPVCDLLPGKGHHQQKQLRRPTQQQQQQQALPRPRMLAMVQQPSTSTRVPHLHPTTQQQQQPQQGAGAPGSGRFPPRTTPPPTLPPPSPDQLVIFDIDETVLSNLDHLLHPAPNTTWDDWVQAADAPALAPSLCLYQSLTAAGYSVAFVTGRGEAQRDATMRNLEAAGYGAPCGQPARQRAGAPKSGAGAAGPAGTLPNAVCYSALLMRAPGDTRLASVFKPWARQQLLDGTARGMASAGADNTDVAALHPKSTEYTLLALLGDQFSDLNGDVSAPYAFKLPNPFYFIL